MQQCTVTTLTQDPNYQYATDLPYVWARDGRRATKGRSQQQTTTKMLTWVKVVKIITVIEKDKKKGDLGKY